MDRRPSVAATPFDPTVVDPTHYRVEFENDRVRVLRMTYEAHGRGVWHEHPRGVSIWLTDAHGRMHLPDGGIVDFEARAGQVDEDVADAHEPENLGDEPVEAIIVELK